ncbi:MAG: hypothetical protein WCS25_06650, partial [Victivallaceae bacterium]
SFNEFTTPLQLYYMSKGFENLCKFPELMTKGNPDISFKLDNAKLASTRFADDQQALIFIANYASPEEESFTLSLPRNAVRIDKPAKSLPAGKHQLKLGPAEFMLYHIR